jgi:GPH family glycoside/pentoside/hexuronide:cation symporter
LGEKVSYGLGDTAINLFWQFCNIFLLYYYTDVFGIAAATVGTMFVVANMWDAINDPLMGAIADRTRTRHGKYRPYLLWFAIPYGLSGYALFANPDMPVGWKIAFAYVTFLVFKTTLTAIAVPYGAMMGVITDRAEDRVALSTFRFLGAFGGGFAVSLFVRPLVKLFGGDDEVLGFQLTMAVFGVVSVAMLYLTFFVTKERLEPRIDAVDIKTDLALLFRNVPWLVMCGAAVCTLAAVAVRGAVTVHYFKYYVGRADEIVFSLGTPGTPFFLQFDEVTVFMSSGMLAFILAVSLTGFFGRLLGKRNALIILTLLNAVSMLAFFFIPPEAYWTMFIVNLIGNFLAGPTPALVWALYTDVADYGEYRFGRRATGLVLSAAMFAQKLGLTIGGGASGWMLGLFGFVPNQPQTDEATLGIRVMFALVPGGLALLNGFVLILYPLSQADTEAMQTELAARRSAEP